MVCSNGLALSSALSVSGLCTSDTVCPVFASDSACLRFAGGDEVDRSELIVGAPSAPVLHLLEQPIELLRVDRRSIPGRGLAGAVKPNANGDEPRATCPERVAGCRRRCGDESKGGRAHGQASYNAAMATLAATDLRPRRLVIEHLSHHHRGAHARGRAARRLGLRPRARHRAGGADRRRHHRVAVSVRRRPVGRRRSARGVVAGAVRARPDRSREVHGAVPVVAGQRIDVEGLRRSALARNHLGGRPRRSRRRVARRLRLHDSGDVGRRQPRRHGRRACSRRVIPSAARSSSRSPPACVPTAGARRRATCSASWCAMACATATSRPA